VYAVVDKLEREPRATLERKLADAGFAEVGIARIFEVLRAPDLDSLRAQYGEKAELRDDFTRVARYLEHLDALGVADWVQFDLSIVRGLAYYTGIVFELFDAKGELRAICGGGRYDTLLGSLGGVDLPALGFGMGDVVLGELLRERGLMPAPAAAVEVWVAFGEDGGLPSAMRVASRLRARGRSAEYALGGQKLARQLKSADAAGAREVLIVATPELAAGEGIVRRLSDGHEERVHLERWIESK
jgi:histidyl-tRNA synthetase